MTRRDFRLDSGLRAATAGNQGAILDSLCCCLTQSCHRMDYDFPSSQFIILRESWLAIASLIIGQNSVSILTSSVRIRHFVPKLCLHSDLSF
jgi:hypothetical protein